MSVLVTTPKFRAWLAANNYVKPTDPATAFALIALYEKHLEIEVEREVMRVERP